MFNRKKRIKKKLIDYVNRHNLKHSKYVTLGPFPGSERWEYCYSYTMLLQDIYPDSDIDNSDICTLCLDSGVLQNGPAQIHVDESVYMLRSRWDEINANVTINDLKSRIQELEDRVESLETPYNPNCFTYTTYKPSLSA